jgi:hypothetical protein
MVKHVMSYAMVAAAFVAVTAAPSAAQTFAGSTSGCFYQVAACTPTAVATMPAAGPAMTFTGNSFSVSTPNPLSLSGANSLGVVTVGIDPNVGTGWNFLLNVSFTMPSGVAPVPAGANLFTAGLTGTFTNKNDVLSLNFDNTAHTFGFLGGSFTLQVSNDPTFVRTNNGNSETASAQINGQITLVNGPSSNETGIGAAAAVPEPDTYVMVTAGLMILGVAARRRRNH